MQSRQYVCTRQQGGACKLAVYIVNYHTRVDLDQEHAVAISHLKASELQASLCQYDLNFKAGVAAMTRALLWVLHKLQLACGRRPSTWLSADTSYQHIDVNVGMLVALGCSCEQPRCSVRIKMPQQAVCSCLL